MSGPSIELFARHWHMDQNRRSTKADFWDGRSPSFQHHKENINLQRRRDFVSWIAAKCRLGQGARVLDLGCGTGHYSLLWAEWAAEVQAFDLSPKMIELARANSLKGGRVPSLTASKKINFHILDWREADLSRLGWLNHFELTFACRTPAICDHESLDKMLASTKDHGVLVGLAEQHSAIKDGLNKIIKRKREYIQAARSIYSAFNLLWLKGYLPEISYFQQSWVENLSLEEAVLLQCRYFEQAGPLSDEEVRLIRKYLENHMTGGLVTEEVEAVSAVMIWPMTR